MGKSLSINTVPVTIRVVEVGGKRMSLSVFKQIQEDYFFSDDYDGAANFLGWVDYSGYKYVLFSFKGNLMKDKFEVESISRSTNIELKLATEGVERERKEEMRYAGGSGYSLIRAEERLKIAIEKHLKEKDFCDRSNKPYYDLMTPETQVFISI